MTHTEDPVASVEEQIALLLRLADRNRRSSRRLEHTLDRSAHLALRQLSTAGPLGINEIADHLRLDASTVTRQVLAMEAAGYVERSRDASDGRRAVIAMTPAGEQALAATRAARHSVYSDVLAGWSTADQTALADLLARLNESLDAHVGSR